ncbi:MAG TPA: transposase [Spirochaetia bacterium]|nr:transposase [Spirochaetia bacterium]
MVRNTDLFARFVSGDFTAADVVSRWAKSDSEYLQRVSEAYNKLRLTDRWLVPVRIYHGFREIRWRWSRPYFKGGSILLDYRVFSIAEAEKTVSFNLWVSMAGTAAYHRVKVPFQLIGRKKDVLEALFPGWMNTNQRKALLVIRGNHIHISIPVEKQKTANPAPTEVLGCDVGITTPVSLSDGKQYGKSFNELVKEEWDKYLKLQETRNKFRTLQKKTEKRMEESSDPREQARLLRKINEYLRHLSDHRWSEMRRRIKATVSTEIGRAVNLLIKDLQNVPGTMVVLEDLSDMSAQGAKRSARGRFDLSTWARGDLQDHLKEDLEWLGGNVAQVVPEYTSQECSECGHVDKENRNGKVFKCKRCGYTEDADVNAAKNIRKRFSDEDMREIAKKYSWNHELRRQKVLELLLERANRNQAAQLTTMDYKVTSSSSKKRRCPTAEGGEAPPLRAG